MNNILKNDLDQLSILLDETKAQSIAYLNRLESRATAAFNIGEQKDFLHNEGIGSRGALQEFQQRLEPLLVGASGPRYWGFVTGGTTPAAIVGDWLTTIYDQNPQSTKGHGDVSANIEIETIRLLLNLFDLPSDFFGGFVTGATMSNFTCLAVARQWVGKQKGIDIAKEGVAGKTAIMAATPHSSAVKSLSMLGLGSNHISKIKTLEGNREAIDVDAFERALVALQGEPCILISSGGTVNTVDFDDFVAISKLKQKYNFWWHIDAAFGAFAACSATHQHLLQGWEWADSITIDCHKWLNVPYESAVFLMNTKHNVLQVETFQNSNAPYLGDPMENFSYLNFLPENSRRLKALPTWFSLMAYGKNGIADIVENNIELSHLFGRMIEHHQAFELLAATRLNTVCFTLRGEQNQEKVHLFLSKLNATAKVFMTPTIYRERKGMRAAFVNWRTKKADVEFVFDLMQQIVKEI